MDHHLSSKTTFCRLVVGGGGSQDDGGGVEGGRALKDGIPLYTKPVKKTKEHNTAPTTNPTYIPFLNTSHAALHNKTLQSEWNP